MNLLLHACCAPCSSYVLEYLSRRFRITVYYYNPNISPEAEYRKRTAEVRRFLAEFPAEHPASFAEGPYDPERFFALVKGHEHDPERGERCTLCYRMRLAETARFAAAHGFESFSTQVHYIIRQEGRDVFYVFDCLSDLLLTWATDLMIGNFFVIT